MVIINPYDGVTIETTKSENGDVSVKMHGPAFKDKETGRLRDDINIKYPNASMTMDSSGAIEIKTEDLHTITLSPSGLLRDRDDRYPRAGESVLYFPDGETNRAAKEPLDTAVAAFKIN